MSSGSDPPLFIHTPESFQHAIAHVFFPTQLPRMTCHVLWNDVSLTRAVCAAAHAYTPHVSGIPQKDRWLHVTKMLYNLQASIQHDRLGKTHIISQLGEMRAGDILTFFMRPQNVAVILTKQENYTLWEAFEVSPSSDAVEVTAGCLTRSYPWSVFEMPNGLVGSGNFQLELANFFTRPDASYSDPPVPPNHLEYVAVLLTGAIPDVSRAANFPRITKRIRDGILTSQRRSGLWLLVRVAIQVSLDRSSSGRALYKHFMLYFMCVLAKDANSVDLPSDMLHLMACKILRRLSKLDSVPDWLLQMVSATCTCLRETLDSKWKHLSVRPSSFQNPSQDELIRDTKLSLQNSHEYIRNALLRNASPRTPGTPFHPSCRRRGMIKDFLSSAGSFFEQAYRLDPDVTLYDVEWSVEQQIDDWLAYVINPDEACAQLEILMEKYSTHRPKGDPEDASIKFLTMIELFVALDKLVVREIPMLADYSPEIPLAFLEEMVLRKATSLHRLSCVYQYLAARHARSRPGWTLFSNEFTEDSFPVRYYHRSPCLQQLKSRIDATETVSPLPPSPLHAKIVVFELQCPPCIRIWRAAAAVALQRHSIFFKRYTKRHRLLVDDPALQPYLVNRPGLAINEQIHLAYIYPDESQSPSPSPMVHYIGVEYLPDDMAAHSYYKSRYASRSGKLADYMNGTAHTSNDVLSAQVDCPTDFSLDEFITFGHLRSGRSLQWFNILHGLRRRSLNLRRKEVHFLLTHAAFQVGPLDLNAATWTWHLELLDSSFCNALLDELDGLFTDAACLMDGVIMSTISLLLARLLASSPSEGISERVIVLLQTIRRKTFKWMQELFYDLSMAPANKERRDHLLEMSINCRCTFDVDPSAFRNLLHFTEDVDALLSCAYFAQALYPGSELVSCEYSELSLDRDRRLSLVLEEVLKGAILADSSDYGVDLAVTKILAGHRPGALRWEPLHPSTRWFKYEVDASWGQTSRSMHLNLLDGSLRLDGRSLGNLPQEIRNHPEYQRIFGRNYENAHVTLSDIPEMDFMTVAMTSEYKVHFSLRGDNLMVRAQCYKTNEILELIPFGILKNDLPPELVDGHVFWLNLSEETVEIRLLERLWEYSSENWRIDCRSRHYHAYRGREKLVDVRSPTWATLSKCLKGFNIKKSRKDCNEDSNVLITTFPIDSIQSAPQLRLSVTLPRYGLSFFVNEREELESHDFKDMVYDEDQCIGTLFGLEPLIVLRSKINFSGSSIPEALIPRRILVPNGFPEKHTDNLVRINDSKTQPDEPLYHTYVVDTEMGCLTGNGSLISMRFLAYLHAATTCYCPDPLTGRMGTDAALCILQSAGCRSIMKLKALSDGRNDRTSISPWSSTSYPQINTAHVEIQNGYYWRNDKCGHSDDLDNHVAQPVQIRAVTAHLFPSTSNNDCEDEERSMMRSHFRATQWQITFDQLFSTRAAPELPPRSTLLKVSEMLDDVPTLDRLFSSLQASSSFQRDYLGLLEARTSTRKDSQIVYKVAVKDSLDALQNYYAECRSKYTDALCRLKKSLGPTTEYEQALEIFGQWPATTADMLLRCLASPSPIKLVAQWKTCLISFAMLLLELQRARRLLCFTLDGLRDDFLKELANEQCDGWNPEEYPDWLLIQIQGNFLIRRTQAETAMEMISPRSRQNTVMQVNMGEGKTSVIIPIVAAALADGKQLVRVIVPKALAVQMFEILVARLGGLINRPVYHLPFSRTPQYDSNGKVTGLQVGDIHDFATKCMTEHGILLVQPEHVVSLKLMSVEKQVRQEREVTDPFWRHESLVQKYVGLISKDSLVDSISRWWGESPNDQITQDATQAGHRSKRVLKETPKWLNLQKWLHSHARDILDESDEILHSRFQLIYASGFEQHVDGYPDRWSITQQILRVVKVHVHTLAKNHPDTVECEHYGLAPGSFPHVRFVHTSDIGQRLISMIVEDVMAGRLPHFNCFQHVTAELRDAVRSFISDKDILQVSDTAKRVEEYAKRSHQNYLWNGLLLLRGLLCSNILLSALAERRWRVDYGLSNQSQLQATPTMLAVPYRAKDVPVPNTQFCHPDLSIILTCLSYYYTGLTEEQLRTSFEILLDQDDPFADYTHWIEDHGPQALPDSLRNLREVNLRSSEQWDKVIFPLFSRNQAAVDFYLTRVVFPKEAKEFPWKLSGSSWDLAEERDRVITGFSGTNDGRWLLPMSVTQQDLDHQQGSTAKVLAYLLQPENDFYVVINEGGQQQTTPEFLRFVATQRPEIHILLDVGAQILDFSNDKVAAAWLDVARDASGVIYFNESDELTVLTRSGIIQPLSSSPLAQKLECCVVYLDHAHTRGTDLKFPIGSRAAVTLGPKVTKDALVQGCMRMRRLGRDHSVMFFAPLGVDQNIRSLKKDSTAPVTTLDVICWAIHETWADIQQRVPYWAKQGMNYKTRREAWSRFCKNDLSSQQLSDAWLQTDVKSLADLYAPREPKRIQGDLSTLDPGIQQRCKDIGVLSLPSVRMDEEQEREVYRERERERGIELPPKAEPKRHSLHPAVIKFVRTGVLKSYFGRAFRPVFKTFTRGVIASRQTGVWSTSILATVDFCETIKPNSTPGTVEQYHRPVQYILSCKQDGNLLLVLLSPFEADKLMPDIRVSEHVHLHVYAPRTSQRMKSSDNLRLYSIPPLPSNWTPPWELIDQLNVFAGQLYLRDYETYLGLRRLLGVPTNRREPQDRTVSRWTLFDAFGFGEKNGTGISGSPLPLVETLLAIRSRGQPFAHTHMGKILQGQILTEKDFKGPTSVASDIEQSSGGRLSIPS